MKNRIRMVFAIGTVVAFLVPSDSNFGSTAFAHMPVSIIESISAASVGQCHPPTGCGGGSRCVPVPTSLVPVDTSITVASGWETAGGSCGLVRCIIILPIPCGKPLSSGACN